MTETTPATATEQEDPPRMIGRPFERGRSPNPHGCNVKRNRLQAEHTAQLVAHHGRPLLPIELELVEQLVRVKLLKPQSAGDTIRQANTVSRLMRALYSHDKPAPAEQTPPTLQEYLQREASS